MSATGTQVLKEVRRILTDTDEGDPRIPNDQIIQAIDRSVPLASSYMALGELKVDAFITLAAGTSVYTLSAATPYGMIGALRFATDNQPITRKSPEYVETLRTGTSASPGRPQVHYLMPKQDGTVDVIFWPTPSKVENVTAWVQLEPQAWGSEDGGTPSTIPFSQGGLRGLELLAAAAVIEVLDAEKCNALRLERSAAKGWRAEAMEHFHVEKISVIRLKRAEGPASPRWLDAWAGVWFGPRGY